MGGRARTCLRIEKGGEVRRVFIFVGLATRADLRRRPLVRHNNPPALKLHPHWSCYGGRVRLLNGGTEKKSAVRPSL